MERHVERFKDVERMERVRVGVAAAAVMNTGWVHKKDGTPWVVWDVFPDLQPTDDGIDEEENAQAILQMFRALAVTQNAAQS